MPWSCVWIDAVLRVPLVAWISFPPPHLLGVLGAMFCLLAAGSLIRLVGLRGAEPELRRKRLASLRTWWILAIVFAAGVSLGRLGISLMLAVASGLAIREYLALVALRPLDRAATAVVYAAVVVHYAALAAGNAVTMVWLPLGLLLALLVVQLVMAERQGEIRGYVRSTATLFWGALVLLYALSHGAWLVSLPALEDSPAGAAGWFVYLVVLTETNDIFQALIGRQFGAHKRHRITPLVSPNKTWEGFLGGMAATVVLAIAAAPWLTSLPPLAAGADRGQAAGVWPAIVWPALAGILISVGGLFGDINMSAVKRDAGVKDSSTLLPGMGGMIDRVDSLSVTAPVFFYLVQWLKS